MSTPPAAPPSALPVLVTGATGYIGGRLVPWLLAAGWRVRCAVRAPEKLAARPWMADPRVSVVAVDLGDPAALAAAMRGCGAVYWLVHSLVVAGRDFHAEDERLARSCAAAAATAGVGRIIYLGGLGETGPGLSEHLASRQAVEAALADGPVPVTTLRAAVILGSGSASFEILRYLVERLPAMVTPKWVRTECQPIAVRNVLHSLVAVLGHDGTRGQTLDIGGPDVVSYRELMQVMAEELGLRRRLIVALPVLTPRLSSWWIHLVTPVDSRLARPLAEGLRNRVVCRDDRAQRLMPQELLGVRAAIRLALGRIGAGAVETSWSDAGPMPGDPDWAGGTVFRDVRRRLVAAPPAAVFAACCRVGGAHGWYATDWLWRLRGALDRVVGGPGLRRGRRDPVRLGVGDAVDFWRVTALEPDRRLELTAEMRLPGEARLEFTVETAPGGARLVQTARFRPRGLGGLLYWYAVLPLHALVFPRLAAGIARAARMPAPPVR
jgi:uncharacterized protein YbjT (DUF2867 family)/uncharacterized protein YndB with AHSA1/START domain